MNTVATMKAEVIADRIAKAQAIRIALGRGFHPAVCTTDLSCFGKAEYLTEEGMVGIRRGNRVTEKHLDCVELDPT